ncbi:hypothetical protein [Streptomyces sp. KR55]|uniref:hypothetical protein n=1 Tax=Streptomyces sp. KR55 TaxID=3457425 RepID=UPI003FD32B1F
MRDRALRGDGELDGRPGQRAVGFRVDEVHAVAQRVVAVASGRQRAAGAHDEPGVHRVQRARGRGGPQPSGAVRGRQGEPEQPIQVQLPGVRFGQGARRARPGTDGGSGGRVRSGLLGGTGACEGGDEIHEAVLTCGVEEPA